MRESHPSIRTYVSALNTQSAGGDLIITETDRDSLRRYSERLNIASATLAQGHDINAPILVGALGMEIALLNTLGLERRIGPTKDAYRTRLVRLFDPARSESNSMLGPSLREEIDKIARPFMVEFEFASWNQIGNDQANLITLLHAYKDDLISCRQAQEQASLINSFALRPLWDIGIDTSHSPDNVLGSSCKHPLLKLHHDLLAHVKGVVEGLGPTPEEQQWLTADWPCSWRWARRLERDLQERMDATYENWKANIAALGCTQ